MKIASILIAAFALAIGPSSFEMCSTAYAQESARCCKTCSKGKACGDSCIARDKACHKPKGCACHG